MSSLLASLAQSAEKLSLQAAVEAPPKADDPPDAPVWEFSFSFTDRRGRLFTGEFTHKIQTQMESLRAAVVRSRLLDGQPVESFDRNLVSYLDIVCQLNSSLTKRPSWADDLLSLDSQEVVYALWDKCSAHIARWFRVGTDSGKG